MQKFLTGVVVTNTAKDTAVVEVAVWKVHRIFKKRYKRTRRYLVHSPENAIVVGTKVSIIPTRPISKRKFWKIEPVVAPITPKKAKAKINPSTTLPSTKLGVNRVKESK